MLKSTQIDLNIETLFIDKIVRPNMVDVWSKTLESIKTHKEQTI